MFSTSSSFFYIPCHHYLSTYDHVMDDISWTPTVPLPTQVSASHLSDMKMIRGIRKESFQFLLNLYTDYYIERDQSLHKPYQSLISVACKA